MKKQFLKKFREDYPRHYVSMIKRNHVDYYNKAIFFCRENNIDLNSPSKILYHYAFDLKSIPSCKKCNSKISSFSVNGNWGYNTFCGKSCAASDKDVIKNRIKSRSKTTVEILNERPKI